MIQLDRRQQLIILLLAGVILFSGGYRLAQIKENSPEKVEPLLESSDENEATVTVHVFGAVFKPGVYQISQGARMIDAVNMAGPTEEADLDSIKLAAKVTDGQDIPVPFKVDIDPSAVGAGQGASTSAGTTRRNVFTAPADGLVNINTANESELDTLPGIGPALAQRIIQYRETNGFFQSAEDIKNVSGIGDKNFENMKDKITVR